MDLYIEKLEKELLKVGHTTVYINKCILYAERLLFNRLPVIFDIEHFSMLTGVVTDELIELQNGGASYKRVEIPKKNKNLRVLSIPDTKLKYLQRWILKNILNNLSISKNAKGFKTGLSIVENAKSHVDKECVINIDVSDFFDSINNKMIYKLFRYYGYTQEISRLFMAICTYEGSLPQGAPTSPYLANLVCKRLDYEINQEIKNNNNINFTRYSDDITISGGIDIYNKLNTIIKIINQYGFEVNAKKTRISYKHQRQKVTGIIVNEKLSVPRNFVRTLRQEIHYCKKFGVGFHMKKKGISNSNYKLHLYGKAYFIKMIDKKLGQKFLIDLSQINWEY